MPKRESHRLGSELFIVDNSEEDWRAVRYLRDWCELSKSIDIATGYFEIGALLALDGAWQEVGEFRILLGDQVALRTQRAFNSGLKSIRERLDRSLEHEKRTTPFLEGTPGIVDALRSGQIKCRIYRKEKFHAKAYITHAIKDVIGSTALVGSSNFTRPGLTQNIELNVQISGPPVAVLQEWYEEHWEHAEDVSEEVINVIEKHARAFSPFEVYARSLQQYFLGYEEDASEWDRQSSQIYPLLAKYQRDAYHSLIKKADSFKGAFLCDGVGLGKTFVGLMLIERYAVHENKNVAVFSPKAALEPVWEREIKNRLPGLLEGYGRLKVFSHTDLNREKMEGELQRVAEQADVVIIDEAHHFRNTGVRGDDDPSKRSRYWRMFDFLAGKQVFLLTATPINNSLLDFQHMVELFSRHEPAYFAERGLPIQSFPGYIRQLEKKIESDIGGRVRDGVVDMAEAAETISQDALFKELVVQRSRSYVKESMAREGTAVLFPEPRKPQVVEYSVKATYGRLLDMISEAFSRRDPLFNLSVYYPYDHYTGKEDELEDFVKGRQKAVVSLIRTNFLKRFESSVKAFESSCWALLWKLLAWCEVHAETDDEKSLVDHWKRRNKALIGFKPEHDLFEGEPPEDLYPPEIAEQVDELDRDKFDIEAIIQETTEDLNQLVDFLKELEKFTPSNDAKLRALVGLLKTDKVAKAHKAIVFTEFADTARYLEEQLKAKGIDGVDEIDGGSSASRAGVIRRFAPYYNESSSAELAEKGQAEIRILIATDVLSEGLNLQDATRLVNYDIHWNPVRLMQRIGRIDRRMNADIEARMLEDHPDQKDLRGTVGYWNFLPPGELDTLLRLYSRVAQKTLRISKTLGIEGKKLLADDDDFEDLRNFAEEYEGKPTAEEKMRLLWQELVNQHEGLEERVHALPDGIFSGKAALSDTTRGVFFCYARPGPDRDSVDEDGNVLWTAEAGDVRWYLYDLATGEIADSAPAILKHIQCKPDAKRRTQMARPDLLDIKKTVERHISKTHLKKQQAPIGVRPILRAWMELN